MQTDTTTPNIVGLTMLAQQLPTTHNKRTQHVTSNDVGSCWPRMLRPYGQVMLRSPIPLITLEPLLSGHLPNSVPSVHGRGSLCCASRDFKMPRPRSTPGPRSSRPLDKGTGGSVSQKLFSPLRASVWQKIRRAGPHGPVPWIMDQALVRASLNSSFPFT